MIVGHARQHRPAARPAARTVASLAHPLGVVVQPVSAFLVHDRVERGQLRMVNACSVLAVAMQWIYLSAGLTSCLLGSFAFLSAADEQAAAAYIGAAGYVAVGVSLLFLALRAKRRHKAVQACGDWIARHIG